MERDKRDLVSMQSELDSLNTTSPPNNSKAEIIDSTHVRPWVRFFARYSDLLIFAASWHLLFPSALPQTDINAGMLVIFLWIFVEPIFLSTWGTTPGKWLLKIKLTTRENKKPSFFNALGRSFNVWFFGLGMGLPVISLVILIISYFDLTKKGITTWDKHGKFQVTHNNIGVIRIIITILLLLFIIVISNYRKLHTEHEASELETTLRQTQPFKIISENNPLEFQDFITKVRNNAQDNNDPELNQIYSRELIDTVFPKYLSNASNQAIFNLLQIKMACYEKIYQMDPALIIQLEFPTQSQIVNIPPELMKCFENLLAVQTEIIESNKSDTKPEISEKKATIILNSLISYLSDKYGQDIVTITFTNPYSANIDKKVEAKIIIDFYIGLISLGEDNAGIVVRQLATVIISEQKNQAPKNN